MPLKSRAPAQAQCLARRPRLDHRVVAGRQPQPLSRGNQVIAEVMVARQPRPARHHGQLAAKVAQAQCPPWGDFEQLGDGLRFHHQSPAKLIVIIGAWTLRIQ